MAEIIKSEVIQADTIKVGEITDDKGQVVTALPPHIAPTTTNEENMNTAGQRRINLIWEHTQAAIALVVTFSTMIGGLLLMVAQVFMGKGEMQIPTILSVAFGTVVGFYFSRTNHQAIGGIGSKRNTDQEYKGR